MVAAGRLIEDEREHAGKREVNDMWAMYDM